MLSLPQGTLVLDILLDDEDPQCVEPQRQLWLCRRLAPGRNRKMSCEWGNNLFVEASLGLSFDCFKWEPGTRISRAARRFPRNWQWRHLSRGQIDESAMVRQVSVPNSRASIARA